MKQINLLSLGDALEVSKKNCAAPMVRFPWVVDGKSIYQTSHYIIKNTRWGTGTRTDIWKHTASEDGWQESISGIYGDDALANDWIDISQFPELMYDIK